MSAAVVGLAGALAFGASASADLLGGSSSTPPPQCQAAQSAPNVLSSLTGPAQFALCNLNSVVYTIYTEYKRPDGTIYRHSTPAALGSTVLVNASGTNHPAALNNLTSDGFTPELQVTLRPEGADAPAGLRFTATTVGGIPTPFPISVEAVMVSPSTLDMPRHNLSYGYDTKSATAPDSFVTVFSYGLTGQTSGDPVLGMGFADHFPDQPAGGLLGIGSHDTATQYPLTLIGGTWDGDPTARQKPITGRLTFAPAPDGQTQANITLGKTAITTDYTQQPAQVGLLGTAPLTPSVVTASVNAVQPTKTSAPTDTLAVNAHIDHLPSSVHVVYDQPDTVTSNITYHASDPINVLDASVNVVTGSNPLQVNVHTTGIPTDMTFHQGINPGNCQNLTAVPPNKPTRLDGKCDAGYVMTSQAQPATIFSTPNGAIGTLETGFAASTAASGSTPSGTLPTLPVPVGDVPATAQGVAADLNSTPAMSQLAVYARINGLSNVQYLAAVPHLPANPATSQPQVAELPHSLTVSHTAGPFDISYKQLDSGRSVTVGIQPLPANLNLLYYPEAKKAHYGTDQNVPVTVDVNAVKPADGVDALTLHSVFTNLPSSIDVDYGSPDPTSTNIHYVASSPITSVVTNLNVQGPQPVIANVSLTGVPTEVKFHQGIDPGNCTNPLAVPATNQPTYTDKCPAGTVLSAQSRPHVTFATPNGAIGTVDASFQVGAGNPGTLVQGVIQPTSGDSVPLLPVPTGDVPSGHDGVSAVLKSATFDDGLPNGEVVGDENEISGYAHLTGVSNVDYLGAAKSVAAVPGNLGANPAQPAQAALAELPLALTTAKTAGPFDVHFHGTTSKLFGGNELTAGVQIYNLPAVFNMTYAAEAQKAHYDSGNTGSTVDKLTADVKSRSWGGPSSSQPVTVHAVVASLPATVDATFSTGAPAVQPGQTPPPTPNLLDWSASSTVPDIQLEIQGLGAPIDWAQIHLTDLPKVVHLGMDEKGGIGLLPGSATAITTLEVHAGEKGVGPWVTPVTANTWTPPGDNRPTAVTSASVQPNALNPANTIFAQKYISSTPGPNNGKEMTRLDIWAWSVQEGWFQKTLPYQGVDHDAAIDVDPQAPQTSVHATFGVANPGPIHVVLPKADATYGSPTFYQLGDTHFQGSDIYASKPPQRIDLGMTDLQGAPVSAVNLDADEATRIYYHAYVQCPFTNTITCDAPSIPGAVTARITAETLWAAASWFNSTAPDVYKVSSTNAAVMQLPGQAAFCIGSSTGCDARMSTIADANSHQYKAPPNPVVLLNTYGALSKPMVLDSLNTCSTTAQDAQFQQNGACDGPSGWPNFRRDTLGTGGVQISNDARIELASLSNLDHNLITPNASMSRIYAETEGSPISVLWLDSMSWDDLGLPGIRGPYNDDHTHTWTNHDRPPMAFTTPAGSPRNWGAFIDGTDVYSVGGDSGSLHCHGVDLWQDDGSTTTQLHSGDVPEETSADHRLNLSTGELSGGLTFLVSGDGENLKLCNG